MQNETQESTLPSALDQLRKKFEETVQWQKKLEAAKLLEKSANTDSRSISPQKLAAALLNSQSSTGPKTKRGKSYSRMNPLKHGLTSDLLITQGPGAEDVREFEQLRDLLFRAYAPVGELETMAVEKILVSKWRYMRSLRCERGLIQKGFVRKLEHLTGKAFPFQTYGTENEEYERDQRLNEINEHLSLPLGSELEQVLRYQTAMERQEARALTDLERLQRERAGEHVLPPVKVQLSTDASILLPDCAAVPATVPIRHEEETS